jgi:hypothetical protein
MPTSCIDANQPYRSPTSRIDLPTSRIDLSVNMLKIKKNEWL